MPRLTGHEAKSIQRDRNPQTLKMLIEAGSDVSQPHVIENFFHRVDPAKVSVMTRSLSQHDYQNIQSSPELDPELNLMAIIAEWTTIPTEDNLGRMTDLGVDIAAAFGCDYDGWGTESRAE